MDGGGFCSCEALVLAWEAGRERELGFLNNSEDFGDGGAASMGQGDFGSCGASRGS